MGFFEKLKEGLSKTRTSFIARINDLFSSFVRVDEDLLDELEEILITADIGVETTEEILDELREAIRAEHLTDPQAVRDRLFAMLREGIGDGEPIRLEDGRLTVLLVIGVNGVGKTTSIAKIAHVLKEQGKNVLLCAADTFRAAAIDQLAVWADRVGVELIHQSEGADPAAVVFDALGAVGKRGTDVLIVDTAGRLHNKKNLMMELEKINRVIARERPDAIRETLLVLDATTGQNAVVQAKEFQNAAAITGLVLTKLDGSAKGGIVLSVKRELGIPVKFIGVGEHMEDLQPFCADDFIEALFH